MKQKFESSGNISSDELHNQNCFDYITHLTLPEDSSFKAIFSQTTQNLYDQILKLKDKKYEDVKQQSFGNLLSDFLRELQNDHTNIAIYREGILESDPNQTKTETKDKLKLYHQFLDSIYNNPNKGLQNTFKFIERYPNTPTPILGPSVPHQIKQSLRDPWRTRNQNTPAKEETMLRRAWNVTAPTFMPQIYGTNLPYQIQYDYKEEKKIPQELHLGTQAQRIGDETRVAPLFKLWIESRETQKNSGLVSQDAEITHVYINKLKYGKPKSKNSLSGTERLAERNLSMALHKLEEERNDIVVITLPADEGLMHHGAYLAITPQYTYKEVLQKCLHATNNDGLNDFYLSKQVQRRLFSEELNKDSSDESEDKKLERICTKKYEALLIKSFTALGFNDQSELSEADQQAVWFHFINYELADFILQKLQPQTFNISCKDAIDRGAASSAYLNLIRSFQVDNHPLSREEFDRALQAPAAMVKARGMNHHFDRVWNVIDKYVDKNFDELRKDENRSWLINWRDVNCPPKIAGHFLQKKIDSRNKALTNQTEPSSSNSQEEKSKEILEHIEKMHLADIGDKKLLLTIFCMTENLSHDASPETIEQLAKQLPSSSVYLYLKGLMMDFAGYVLEKAGHTDEAQKYYTIGNELKNDASIASDLKQKLLMFKSVELNGSQPGEDTPLITSPAGKK